MPLLYFFREPEKEKAQYEKNFEKIALSNHNKFVFVKLTLNSELERSDAKLLGVKATDLPAIRLVDVERGLIFKYPGEVKHSSFKKLTKFLIEYDDDKL